MEYLLFDVFAERAFEGNQLAVFPRPDGLESAHMQRLAAELNLAESVFLTRTNDDAAPARVRIFTPWREMPFAGHPTIGATVAIADVLQWVPRSREAFVLKEGVGDVAVRVERKGETVAWLKTPPVSFGRTFTREEGAAFLQLPLESVHDEALPQYAGAASPFLFIALTGEAAVDAARLDMQALVRAIQDEYSIVGVFVFCRTSEGSYSRMFAPMSGIAEDPATGSATGPLYLLMIKQGMLPAQPASYMGLQGVKMGRRSVLHVNVRVDGNAGVEVGVGGRAILVGSGNITAV